MSSHTEGCPQKCQCAMLVDVEYFLIKKLWRSPRKSRSGWYSSASRSLRIKTGVCRTLDQYRSISRDRVLQIVGKIQQSSHPTCTSYVFQGSNDEGLEMPVSDLEAAAGGLGRLRGRNDRKTSGPTHKEPSLASGTGRVSRRQRCLQFSNPGYRSGGHRSGPYKGILKLCIFYRTPRLFSPRRIWTT